MRVAVTGAAGHIGAAVCSELLFQGHQVIALVYNDLSAIKDLPIITVKGSVTDRDSLKELMEDCDVVVHTAGMIELGYDFISNVYDINVLGTQNVLDIALEMNIKKVIHFSSIHAYSQKPYAVPVDESRQFVDNKSVFYDQTKRDSHILAQKAAQKGQDVVIVCPTSAVGAPDHKPSKLGKAIIDICNGSIPAVVKGGFDFADVRDVAKGTILAIEKGKSGETYILGGQYYTIQEFSNMVLAAYGSKKKLIELPLFMANIGLPFVKMYSKMTKKAPLYDKVYIDILLDGNKNTLSTKAKSQLGYNVRPLQETLTDTVAWFKATGKIKNKK